MSFSFDPDLGSDLDQVRLNIGDTNEDEVLIEDETIDALLVLYPDVTSCSVKCIDVIIAKESRNVQDRNVIGISTNLSSRAQALKDVQKTLLSNQNRLARAYVSGTTVSQQEAYAADTDLIQPTAYKSDALSFIGGDD